MRHVFNGCEVSPRSVVQPPLPAARALRDRTFVSIGASIQSERQRRGWSLTDLARRARLSVGTVSGVEAGRATTIDTCARLAVALGLSLEVDLTDRRRRASPVASDNVHAAMGEFWARRLRALSYQVAIDHPYQHYQFAGRADVLAWTREPPALLHIENRTRFPDLQQVAGSYNAKRQYLARSFADQLGTARFRSETHVIVGLWSAEVIHSVRLRMASFRALCADDDARLQAWLSSTPPPAGASSSFVLLDPFASGRQHAIVHLDRVERGVRPRVRGYREAAERLRRMG